MLHTTHIAGIPHHKPDLSVLSVGQELQLVPEPDNKFDPNAIKVFSSIDTFLGYIPKTETNFFREYSTVFIHSIQPQTKWAEVTISNEPPQIESGFDAKP